MAYSGYNTPYAQEFVTEATVPTYETENPFPQPTYYNYSSYPSTNTFAESAKPQSRKRPAMVLQEDMETSGGSFGSTFGARNRGSNRGRGKSGRGDTSGGFGGRGGRVGGTTYSTRGSSGVSRGGRGGLTKAVGEWGNKTASKKHPAQALALFFPDHVYDELTSNVCPKTKNMRVSVKLTIPSKNNHIFIGTGISQKIAKHEAAYACLMFYTIPGCSEMVSHMTEKDREKMNEMIDNPAKKLKTIDGIANPINVVSYVHKLYGPELSYQFEQVCMIPKPAFKCTLSVQGFTFEEVANNKKLAKEAVCDTCARAFDVNPPPKVNTFRSHDKEQEEKVEILTPVSSDDHLLHKVYTEIRSKTVGINPVFHRMNNVAGILLIKGSEDDVENFKVVSMAIGRNVILPKSFKKTGTVVHDSSAEVLVIRAFRRFLYDELEKVIDGKLSILEEANGKYRLKPQYKLALAKNEPPLGDSMVYDVPAGKMRRFAHPGSVSDRTKPGATQYYYLPVDPEAEFNPYNIKLYTEEKMRADVISKAMEKHMIATPSDKMTVRNVAGIQGALLSQFLEPVYFHKVVFNNYTNEEAINRAWVDRVEPYIYKVPFPYSINRPIFAKANMRLFNPKNQHSPYAGWANASTNWESIKTDIGMSQSKPKPYPTRKQFPNEVEYYTKKLEIAKDLETTLRPSLLTKRALLDRYVKICQKLRISAPDTYMQCKMQADEYHSVKKLVLNALNKGSGAWVTKKINVDNFPTSDGNCVKSFGQDY